MVGTPESTTEVLGVFFIQVGNSAYVTEAISKLPFAVNW